MRYIQNQAKKRFLSPSRQVLSEAQTCLPVPACQQTRADRVRSESRSLQTAIGASLGNIPILAAWAKDIE